MLEIPDELFRNDTVHRSLNTDVNNSIISCGFLHHKHHLRVNENLCFQHYGALMLLSGEGVYLDEFGNQTKIFPGCFVQRIPHCKHSTITKEDGKWLEFFICFGHDTYLNLEKMGILSSQPVLYPGLSGQLLKAFCSFQKKLRESPDSELPFLLLDAQKIVFSIYQSHHNNLKVSSLQDLLEKSKELLGTTGITDGSSHEVAAFLGIGYENFRKHFKDVYGISPHSYIIQKRMNQAKDLLLKRDLPIHEIALAVGFPDIYSFSKQFKKYTTLTPSEFRAQHLS